MGYTRSMGERARSRHGTTFLSAVTGAPWDDVAPLAAVLEVPLSSALTPVPEADTLTPAHAAALWQKLSYLGSNDLAYLLRGFAGVDYPEIVRDVCKHLRLAERRPGEDERVVEHNEQLVLAKLFADAWDELDGDQRREHLRELNLDEGNLPLAGAGVAAAALAGKGGPFAVYKLSRLVANSVARALPARRLAATRRKTVQAVVLVASLRQAQRTALAETALVGSELPGAGQTAASPRPGSAGAASAGAVSPGATRRPAARKRAAKRIAAPPPAGKKKARPAPSAATERTASASRPPAAKKKRTAKKKAARKATAKKPPAATPAAKKPAAKKRRAAASGA